MTSYTSKANAKELRKGKRENPRRRYSFLALRKDGLRRRSESAHAFIKDDEKYWYRCAMECNMEEIKRLLQRDSSLRSKKDMVMGFTALHWAAKKGHREMVEFLASTGMDVNLKTTKALVDLTRALFNFFFFFMCCQPFTMIKRQIKGGYTALHFAVIQGHEEVISILIEDYGADINIRDNSGRKPRHYLREDTSLWIQRMLGKDSKPAVNVSDEDGAIAKSLETIGSLLLPITSLSMDSLSTSLGSGLDKIGSDSDPLTTNDNNNENDNTPIQKGRSSSFVKFCHSFKGITKKDKSTNLEIPDDGTPRYYRTGRAKSAPDIKHVIDWKPRILLLPQ
ncbi:ankyrin repeat domain-containing protein SOWAHA-like [Actinia tenebrosa]|uniref:Ankyrin repeat domain-containing protein SOWAHA-like n=1 Tax=Actinia tenebrosa TaxID=6105 RepID=A0A6P8H6M6_ACTTE|nr:ankyrin repeat domain-containing protein SOWAHA-like [Actinia tenebrosa]